MFARASDHSLAEIRDDLTRVLFGYLAETETLGRTERAELRQTQREWDEAIDLLVGGPTAET